MSEPSAPSEPAPARPPSTGAPAALVIAAAVSLIVGFAITMIVTYAVTRFDHTGDRSTWTAQFLFVGRGLLYSGTSFAISILAFVGLNELARRSGPGTDGVFLRVAATMAGVMVAAGLARCYLHYWWLPQADSGENRFRTLETYYLWQNRILCVAACIASAALIAAGRRLAAVLWTALPLMLFTVLEHPTTWLYELLSFKGADDKNERWLEAAIDIWIRFGFWGALMATVTTIAASLPPAPTDMVRAGQGLERVGSGLVARVIVILVGAFTLIMTVGAQSPSMARVAGVIFPTLLLVASIAIVTGMIQAGGLSADGSPRLRLYSGAALTITAMVIEALKAISIYLALRRGDIEGYTIDRIRHTAEALPYVTPALALAGLLCTLSAAARLRKAVPEARVDESSINAAAVSVIIFTAAAVALLRWAQGGVKSPATFVIVSLMVAMANIVAQLAVARVCHRVGAAMREVSALPTAVATVR